MKHSIDCPAYALADTVDYDPEDCRGGDCPVAVADREESLRWVPVPGGLRRVPAPAPAATSDGKAGAA